MNRLHVAIAGSLNVDRIAKTERLPGPGETVGGGVLETTPGGKGANQASAAARLSLGTATVAMIGAVGHDASGDLMVEALEDAGVDTSLLQRVDAATGTAIIVVDAEGENQIAVCTGANGEAAAPAEMPDFDAIIAQLEVPVPFVEAISQASDAFFVLNAAPAIPVPDGLVERADLVVVNETEHEILRAARGGDLPGLVAVSLGPAGAILLDDGVEVARAASPETEAVSTVGAGDAFCAALTLGLASGQDRAAALQTACNVGAAAVADPRSQPLLAPIATYREAVA